MQLSDGWGLPELKHTQGKRSHCRPSFDETFPRVTQGLEVVGNMSMSGNVYAFVWMWGGKMDEGEWCLYTSCEVYELSEEEMV